MAPIVSSHKKVTLVLLETTECGCTLRIGLGRDPASNRATRTQDKHTQIAVLNPMTFLPPTGLTHRWCFPPSQPRHGSWIWRKEHFRSAADTLTCQHWDPEAQSQSWKRVLCKRFVPKAEQVCRNIWEPGVSFWVRAGLQAMIISRPQYPLPLFTSHQDGAGLWRCRTWHLPSVAATVLKGRATEPFWRDCVQGVALEAGQSPWHGHISATPQKEELPSSAPCSDFLNGVTRPGSRPSAISSYTDGVSSSHQCLPHLCTLLSWPYCSKHVWTFHTTVQIYVWFSLFLFVLWELFLSFQQFWCFWEGSSCISAWSVIDDSFFFLVSSDALPLGITIGFCFLCLCFPFQF